MKYCSTRNATICLDSFQAILQGIAPDGGLLLPADLREIRLPYEPLLQATSQQILKAVLNRFFPEIQIPQLDEMIRKSYKGRFETSELVSFHDLSNCRVLELFRGPTAAFKDVALCLLPQMLHAAAVEKGVTEDVTVVTATSGDTGKAALEGFRDVPGTRVVVFYPYQGVSAVQQAQMATQPGSNLFVCAVRGNFDDAQSAVKQIFRVNTWENAMGKGLRLTSANSINIARLAPQIFYYYRAYASLVQEGQTKPDEKINFVVPTGNFGNILAGYLAKRMGLPIHKLICASNANHVLSDFLRTGVYDARRDFLRTSSPSMDILISSNLERLLYITAGADEKATARRMQNLSQTGRFTIEPEQLALIQETFADGWATEEQTADAIRTVWEQEHYLMDPHTAVGFHVLQAYQSETGDQTKTVLLSTASPFKFSSDVLCAIGEQAQGDEFDQMEQLSRITGIPAPVCLSGLRQLPVLHNDVIDVEQMPDYTARRAEAMR